MKLNDTFVDRLILARYLLFSHLLWWEPDKMVKYCHIQTMGAGMRIFLPGYHLQIQALMGLADL